VEEIDGIDVDLSLLPPDLASLAPLIRRYAVGDDVERTRRLEVATPDELLELEQAAAPHWDAVNAYLDANMERPGAPEQDVALVLDGFAQAALEAPFERDRR
jgi:hypothetical protein